MQTRSSNGNSVCLSVRPSVCPSVTRMDCDKTVERSVQIYIPYEKTFNLVFWEEEWLMGATLCTWNFGSTGPRWSKIAYFEPIIARRASAVTPSDKSSINANRKSTTRFPMSLRWSSYVASKYPKEGLKNAKRPTCVKSRTSLEESLLQSFFLWKLSAQSCKAFIGLPNRAIMIVGGGATPSTWNFQSKWPRWSKMWTISCDNSETVRDRMSVTINH